MTILLTNDDGVDSGGLAAARQAIIDAGLRVVSIAPDGARSGGSRAATFRKPVGIEIVGGDENDPIYACTGTPVDCVRVALLSDLVPDVSVVISGINEGGNIGDDTTYSSTVGAAIEGALLGVGSIAVSQQSLDGRFRVVDVTGYDWTSGAELTALLAAEAIRRPIPARGVVNVNFPGSAPTSPSKVTRLGMRAYRRGGLEMEHAEHGHGYYSFGTYDETNDPPIHEAQGTDFSALADGSVSITPLSFEWQPGDVRGQLDAWAANATRIMDAHLGLKS